MQKTSSALLLFGCVLVSMAAGMAINLLFSQFFGLTFQEPTSSISPTQADHWYPRMFLSGLGHVFTFLIPAIFFWYFFEQNTWKDFSVTSLKNVSLVLIPLVIIIVLIPANQQIIEWNQQIHLPGIFTKLETWMRVQEQERTIMIQRLLQIDSLSKLLVAFTIFGVVGPFGEEVFFRGVLQTKLRDWGMNPGVSIWVAAVIFSLIHFQFYGFFPRLFLGALFGYLFLWSGNIWVPILAHVVNNGLFVLTAFSHQNWPFLGHFLESSTSGWIWPILSLILAAVMLHAFKTQNFSTKPSA